MSVDGFYAVKRPGTVPEELFRALCAEHGVARVDVQLEPRDLDEVDAAAAAFGLEGAFTQVVAAEAVADVAADFAARWASRPRLPDDRDPVELALAIDYRRTTSTLQPWKDLGKKKKTPVETTFVVGVDALRSRLFLGVELDCSKAARGFKGRDGEELQAWWRGQHHAFLDERLARLGLEARFDLDVNEPRRLSSSEAVTIEQGGYARLSYPVVFVDLAALGLDVVEAFRRVEGGLGADRVQVSFAGPARDTRSLRSWLPPVENVHGPAAWDPLPLASFALPRSFAGRASLIAAIGDDDEGGDLMLWIGEAPRLVLAVRWGLMPEQQEALEEKLGVQLVLEHAG